MSETMIRAQDLAKSFGPVEALRGVTFTVPRGQVVGLLGPNGAGKTTMMRILTGYVAPTRGSADVGGHDVVEEPLLCQRRIGYLPEGNPLYPELRLGAALRFAARLHGLKGAEGEQAVGRSVEAAGLHGRERQVIGTLSKGFRQRVGLAQALLHEPDVLILDEPTSGLDPNQQEEMRELIRRLGQARTVLLSTHVLSEVEAVCDRALIIHEGALVADDSVAEIKARDAGRASVRLVLHDPGRRAEQVLGALPFVSRVQAADDPQEGEVRHVHVVTSGPPDRGRLEALAGAAHAGGLPLSGLAVETASLDQVFARLTGSTRRGEGEE